MPKTTQITVPPHLLSVGALGPFTSGLLPSSLKGYQLEYTNTADWPATGDVITTTVEQSNDSGSTWAFDAAITFTGGAWKTRQGADTNIGEWSVQLDNLGSTTRKARVKFNVFQACTLGVTLSSV